MARMELVGRAIGRYPWIFLISSLFIVIPFLSYFILKPIRIETDIRRGFAPKNGRAMEEFKAFIDYRKDIENVELGVVLIEAPKGKDEMEMNYELIQELEKLTNEIDSINVPFGDGDGNSTISFKAARGRSNYLFEIFLQMFQAKNESLFVGDSFIQLRFPVCEVMGNKFNIGGHFFGVKEYPKNEWSKHESSIESIEAIALWYIFEIPQNDSSRMEIIKQLEIKLFELTLNQKANNFYKFHMYADVIANEEMARGSRRTVNLLIFGLLLMLGFMCISLYDLSLQTKFILIPAAVLTPLLAAITTFGLLGWSGFSFNSIMAISPFLLLGIGVDDAFLLLHCWKKYQKNNNKENSMEVDKMMGKITAEVGPSILITSITNFMAFGVGFFAPAPLLSNFCLCTSIAVLIDFLFEFTIFAACLAIISKRNISISSKKSTKYCLVTNSNYAGTATIDSNPIIKDINKPTSADLLPLSLTTTVPATTIIVNNKKNYKAFKNSILLKYCKFVTSKNGKLIALGFVIILYILSFFGAMKMRTTFEPQKTFPLDSALQESLRLVDKVFVQYSPITFVVNNPPNITNPEDYLGFMKFVEELEALPETYGPDWTQLFLRDYIAFDHIQNSNTLKLSSNNNETTSENFSTYLPTFNNLEKYADERGINGMKIFNYNKDPYNLQSFLFVLVCHGKRSWHDRAYFIEKVRAITDKYSNFKVTVFDYDATIFDLIITVKLEMMKAVLVTLICMFIVCFIIIPSIFYTGIALLSIISIAFTLVGALGWWGQDLDPVVMINVLMAIGFSVDFCAHICYHYYKYCNKTFDSSTTTRKEDWPHLRLYLIMNSVGRPTFEAALSTMICMIPLFFIDVYVVQCFAKTVICVGSLGILHGLFLIPVTLSSKENFFFKPTNEKEKEEIKTEEDSAKSLFSLTNETIETEIDSN